jgi:hypothetical protein
LQHVGCSNRRVAPCSPYAGQRRHTKRRQEAPAALSARRRRAAGAARPAQRGASPMPGATTARHRCAPRP